MDQKVEIDQINIRELIETIIKGRIIIAVMTIIAVLSSVVINFFILQENYEAKAVLMVSVKEIKTSDSEGIPGIINNLAKMPIITLETYLEQLKSPAVLENTIKKLELKDADGNFFSTERLSSAVSVAKVKDTNLLEIKVNNHDPEMATLIADTMSQYFIEFVTENSKKNSQQTEDLLQKQLSIEEQNIKEKLQALAEYWSKNSNIDLLKLEVDNLVSQIGNYKKELRDADTQISSDTAALKILESALMKQDNIKAGDYRFNIDIFNATETATETATEKTTETADKTATEKATEKTTETATETTTETNTEILERDQIQLNIPSTDLYSSLLTVNFSKTQARLIDNITKRNALENTIKKMGATLLESQILLVEDEYKFNAINRDLELAQQAYNAYQKMYKEAMIIVAANSGNTNIIISSKAVASDRPISPDKMTNILVAALVGLFLGIVIVLFRAYWKSKEPT